MNLMDDLEFPLIAPHEGREFELMEQGRKNVALFYDIIPDQYGEFRSLDQYGAIEWSVPINLTHAQKGSLRERGAHYEGLDEDGTEIYIPYRILYRKNHEAQARRLADLVQNYGVGWDIEKEREIGAILGYPKESIEQFVRNLENR